jgi:hypothetical protein
VPRAVCLLPLRILSLARNSMTTLPVEIHLLLDAKARVYAPESACEETERQREKEREDGASLCVCVCCMRSNASIFVYPSLHHWSWGGAGTWTATRSSRCRRGRAVM